MSIDKLKSRIGKLLTLSRDSGATEAEALASMEKAMQLMAAHQLSMADVEGQQEQTDQPIEQASFYDNSRENWRRLIWFGTAKLYMCDHFYSSGDFDTNGRRWNTKHTLIGEPANIEIASSMAARFIEIGEALALTQAGMGRSYIDSFKKGYASRMFERFKARKLEAQSQTVHSSTGSALVLADQYRKAEAKIARYRSGQNIKIRSQKVGGGSNRNGYYAGRSAAEGVAMGGSLSGASSQMRLLG
jgi:hypothetical protein